MPTWLLRSLLAGLGFERHTAVLLLADPAATLNVHTIEAEGTFGSFRTELIGPPARRQHEVGVRRGQYSECGASRTAGVRFQAVGRSEPR